MNPLALSAVVSIAGAYAIGCLTTGYYLVRLCGQGDIRAMGSGSIGARNVGRVLGWRGFLLTFAGDAAKGAGAVVLVSLLAPPAEPLAILAVVAGHIWPVQLRFRGGKGVATAAGALIVWNPLLFSICAGVSGIVLAITKSPIVALIVYCTSLPILHAALGGGALEVLALVALSAIVVYRHGSDIRDATFAAKAGGRP